MPASLSPSRASDFMQCPLLYRFRVIDKLPESPSAAASRGTLVHSVLERIFDVDAPNRTLERALDLVPHAWEDMLTDEPELAELVGSTPHDLATWLRDAEKLVEKWFAMENPQFLEPAERELYVEADLDGLTLRGYIDRLDVAPGGQIRVVDYKTGRAPSELFENKALFQMKFYALVIWRTRGVMPLMLQLVYLGNSQFLRYQPDEADLLALERKLKALWRAIERCARTGDWRPKKSRLCSWCDHKALCPEWGGTPPPLPEHAARLALDPRTTGDLGDVDGD
ncbi:PD-(D/E)XK nuclease family protein [Dermacoccus nishinomiyaensis]|uniref:RecB family exonuclease n=1 Tax=Dermacoccus nishinomiyaensis TaxID=1274 RepID=UPI0030D0ACD3